MSGPTSHKKTYRDFSRHTAPEVTVQPRQHDEQVSFDPDEIYASLAPEELGGYALRAATQSGYPLADSAAHGLGAIAVTYVRIEREPCEEVSDDELWAETLELAVEYGAGVEVRASHPFEDEISEQTWSRDVDLHQTKVVEASLFDPGSQETVHETRKPRVIADDDSAEHTQLIARGRQRTTGISRAARSAAARSIKSL